MISCGCASPKLYENPAFEGAPVEKAAQNHGIQAVYDKKTKQVRITYSEEATVNDLKRSVAKIIGTEQSNILLESSPVSKKTSAPETVPEEQGESLEEKLAAVEAEKKAEEEAAAAKKAAEEEAAAAKKAAEEEAAAAKKAAELERKQTLKLEAEKKKAEEAAAKEAAAKEAAAKEAELKRLAEQKERAKKELARMDTAKKELATPTKASPSKSPQKPLILPKKVSPKSSPNNGLVNSVLKWSVIGVASLAARAIMGAKPAKKEKAATASASPKSGVNPLKAIGKFGGCVMKDDFAPGVVVRLTACTLELNEAPIKNHFRI
ncbi:hypothetical protein RI054_04g20550 [Pseudoscourfieldia marina]